ncbi:MAG: XrtA system polysaccharide deacetylase [Planctomycetota bacterium]
MSVIDRGTTGHNLQASIDAYEGNGSRKAARPSSYFAWKGAVDRSLAAMLMVVGLPVTVVLVLLVRMTSRGPGIYRQTRVGRDGVPFTMLKIRTMRYNAEAETGAVWARENDDRTTLLGRVLRKLHLDEFPQLFNVLAGRMYLVGPRPERPEFAEILAPKIPGYLDRLAVKPGITGLAQLNVEPDTSLASVREKLRLDLEYIRSATPVMDMRIVLCTLIHLLGIKGELAARITGLRRQVDWEEIDAEAASEEHVSPDAIAADRPQPTVVAVANSNGRRAARRSRFACTRSSDPINAFTVDVEDYYHVTAFAGDISRDDWHRYDTRVVDNTRRMLAMLDRHSVRATFFVLGWVAERHPQLIRAIHHIGHEVGSHGYWHRCIYDQSPDEFRDDLRKSRDVLSDIISAPVTAYRAPTFSVTRNSLWALDILVEEGFTVDSSIFPVWHDRYGIPDAEPYAHQIATASGTIWECPPSIVKLARLNCPIGGGYFRICPLPWTLYGLSTINRKQRRPSMFYIHPWEIDPDQPRLKAGSRMSRFRHRVNLSATEQKLDVLLETFRFGPISDVVKQTQENHQPLRPARSCSYCK